MNQQLVLYLIVSSWPNISQCVLGIRTLICCDFKHKYISSTGSAPKSLEFIHSWPSSSICGAKPKVIKANTYTLYMPKQCSELER